MAIASGTRFGPYEIVVPLGAGGMGEVYRALDTRLGRHVALKVLPDGAAADRAFRERFAREARTISSLSHPNICALFDVGEQDGNSYLVMEYLDGETLSDRLVRGPLPVADAVDCAIQIADGLARAHAHGIVHRDLKPGNVMLLEGGLVKILDFGLAKHYVAESGDATMAAMTEAGALSGTVAYMSPEQATGGMVDHRSDLFSFGILLYEMLAGVRPFQGTNAFTILQQITGVEPPPVETRVPGVPGAIGDLLERLLAKPPGHRPQSARGVGAELREIAAQSAPRTRSGGWGARRWLRPRRSRRHLVAAAALGVVVLVLLALPAVRTGALRLLGEGRAPADPGAASAPAPAVRASSYDLAQEGRAYLYRFDRPANIDRAIASLLRAIEADPTHAFSHASLAEAYVRKHAAAPDPTWIRQAIESGRRSVDLNPDLAAAHAALGFALVRAKQSDEGRSALQHALQLDPTLALAHVGMGEYYMSQGDTGSAEAAYRKAVAQTPDDWHPVLQLGRSLYAQARYTEAAEAWEQARARTPDNPVVLRNLGAAYHMLERTDEAAAAFQRALEIEPNATLYSNLGTLRFFQGRHAEAAAAFEKAVELNSTSPLYWANLGDAYRRLPDKAEPARQAYQRAITEVQDHVRSSPSDPELRTQLALYRVRIGDAAGGREELQRWRALTRKTPASHFRALLAYEISGDRDAALTALAAALDGGYAMKEIRGEPDLASLRNDPRYERIVARYQAGATPSR